MNEIVLFDRHGFLFSSNVFQFMPREFIKRSFFI